MTDENKILNDIVSTLLVERKRDYRNKIIFRFFIAFIFLALLFLAPLAKNMQFSTPHLAVIEINGLISAGSHSSAEKIVPLLHEASSNENSTAIIIKINSGGGSATQSKIIYD